MVRFEEFVEGLVPVKSSTVVGGSRDTAVASLLDWAGGHGALWAESVGVVEMEGRGRCLVAEGAALAATAAVVAVPIELLLSFESVDASADGHVDAAALEALRTVARDWRREGCEASGLTHALSLALLVHEAAVRGAASFWAPYLGTLPPLYGPGSQGALYWSVGERRAARIEAAVSEERSPTTVSSARTIRGGFPEHSRSFVKYRTIRKRDRDAFQERNANRYWVVGFLGEERALLDAKLGEMHRTVFAGRLARLAPDAFPLEQCTLARLEWAHAIWWSRAMSPGQYDALVPVADLLNHKPGSLSEWREWTPPCDARATSDDGAKRPRHSRTPAHAARSKKGEDRARAPMKRTTEITARRFRATAEAARQVGLLRHVARPRRRARRRGTHRLRRAHHAPALASGVYNWGAIFVAV